MTSRLAVFVALACTVTLLVGCATPYQKKTILDGLGYSDEKLEDGVYRVTYVVSPFTPPEDALKYWHQRARELCGSDGYEGHAQERMRGRQMKSAYVQGIVRCGGSAAAIATIRDTGWSEDSRKVLFFYVSEIDGKSIENSLDVTRSENQGRGLQVEPRVVERQILAEREVRLTLNAAVHFAAPILALINMGKNYTASAVIRFEPKANGVYVVAGKLSETEQSVWLEDETGVRVGTPDPTPAKRTAQ